MSSPSSDAGSDAGSDWTDTTEVWNTDPIALNQADVDAAMTLLDVHKAPQPEIEGERWTSNVPAAMQAAQPPSVQVQVKNWGSVAVLQGEDVNAEIVKNGVNRRIMPSRAMKDRRSGSALKRKTPDQTEQNGFASKKIVNCFSASKKLKLKLKKQASVSLANSDPPTNAMHQIDGTQDQQRHNSNTTVPAEVMDALPTPVQATSPEGQHLNVSNETAAEPATNGHATPNEAAVNNLILYHAGNNQAIPNADGSYLGPIPTEKNLCMTLYTCGHVSIDFFDMENGSLLVSRDHPCLLIPCQTMFPQHTWERTWRRIAPDALENDLKQFRAELGTLNAVISQALFRLEFALTGALEPGVWLVETRDRVVKRETKLPVIRALLGMTHGQQNLWYVHSYLQAARILLEQAQLSFRRFSIGADQICEDVEEHLAAGRFTAEEIDRLGAILPAGNDRVNDAGR